VQGACSDRAARCRWHGAACRDGQGVTGRRDAAIIETSWRANVRGLPLQEYPTSGAGPQRYYPPGWSLLDVLVHRQ
jgi:hypothetical protein